MGLMATGQTWLQTQMEAESVSITYLRGATSLSFGANPDAANEAGLNASGQIITFGERDWAFALAELATLTPPSPQTGDKIRWVIGTQTHEWRVQPLAAGPLFDDLDTRRGRIALHTIYGGTV